MLPCFEKALTYKYLNDLAAAIEQKIYSCLICFMGGAKAWE